MVIFVFLNGCLPEEYETCTSENEFASIFYMYVFYKRF